MKNDENYVYYILYLKDKMNEGYINKGTLAMMTISESCFTNFKERFENDDTFKEKLNPNPKPQTPNPKPQTPARMVMNLTNC